MKALFSLGALTFSRLPGLSGSEEPASSQLPAPFCLGAPAACRLRTFGATSLPGSAFILWTAPASQLLLSFCAAFLASTCFAPPAVCDPLPLQKLKLPPGFKISLYAGNVTGARSMVLGAKGTLFVGSRETGVVYAIPDNNHDNKGDFVVTIDSKLFHPNGVEFKDGSLYVAEINRVTRYDGIETKLNNPPKPVVVNDTFSKKTHHGQKVLAFGPDGWLYVPVGAPCNVCESKDERFATIMRMKPDGSSLEIFARGIRNTVGIDFHPLTKELWFTDNGRDWLGDNIPPEEINRASKKGMHFGFPYCHGGDILDPELGKGHSCSEFTPPEMKLSAHVAALGIRFYTGKMFPPEYKDVAFICEHGSWNKSVPDGYRVETVTFKDNKPVKREPFITGFLQSTGAWGRPVDSLVMPDGALLVSDDHAGAIYRITYEPVVPAKSK